MNNLGAAAQKAYSSCLGRLYSGTKPEVVLSVMPFSYSMRFWLSCALRFASAYVMPNTLSACVLRLNPL